MKTILATAYDINPYKGSESGTGWNFVWQMSRFYRVIAVTRENNRDNIEKYIRENGVDDANIHFHYYDLPYFLRFWKKGARGSFLYYNLWQLGVALDVRLKNWKFDLAQHVNFHADHVPSFLWILGVPFVWGPINHNEPIPRQFTTSYKEYLSDRVVFWIKFLRWNFDPFLYLCRSKSALVIGSSRAVKLRLNVSEDKFHLLSTVASSPPLPQYAGALDDAGRGASKNFTVISVGRFVGIKSFDVALRAFNSFFCRLSCEERKSVRFLLVGDGPLVGEMQRLADSLECRESTSLIKWVEQKTLFDFYARANVMLVPSHESAGAVVAESQSFGLPVVCFDSFGAGELIDSSSGVLVSPIDYEESFMEMGRAIELLYRDDELFIKLRKGAFANYKNNLSWNSKGLRLNEIFKSIKF